MQSIYSPLVKRRRFDPKNSIHFNSGQYLSLSPAREGERGLGAMAIRDCPMKIGEEGAFVYCTICAEVNFGSVFVSL